MRTWIKVVSALIAGLLCCAAAFIVIKRTSIINGADAINEIKAFETAEITAEPTPTPTPAPTPEPTPAITYNPFIDINAEPRTVVEFGRFEQEDDGGEPEPIEWFVLTNEEDRMFLLSKKGLECFPMRNSDFTWEECNWRTWCNNDFYNAAFTDEEKQWIELSHCEAVHNPDYPDVDPGNDTEDYLFLISIDDYLNCMEGYEEYLICEPTMYARNHNAYYCDGNKNTWWIMRTPGMYQSMWITDYIYTGELYMPGCAVCAGREDHTNRVIRPAMWVSKSITEAPRQQ